jgi:glycosyltransferase involved in cell wall biosynthesis
MSENQNKKLKILLISDHALSTSGVGCQSRFLMNGLIEKGNWTVRQLGAAMKHSSYDVQAPHPEFIIKPIDGFGNPDMIRVLLATEKPDVLMIFTDPRFYTWLWAMEDEIHQVCPIAYWHVWDNYPSPDFNDDFYASTDLINCHSYLTYEIVKEKFPDRTNFIPHALPDELFFKLPENQKKSFRQQLLGPNSEDKFVLFWVNRNAKRKRPNDVLWSWKLFLDKLDGEQRKNVMLLMHTDPHDQEGPNLMATSQKLGILDTVKFSRERVGFEQMNVLHNISDACINIAFAEGFGLATLEAMKVGNPIIACKTGGLTRQVVDHRDGSENGVALDIVTKTLVGSQNVPYIYEDYCSVEDAAEAINKLYSMSKQEREKLGQKAMEYVQEEFAMQKTIDLWHDSLLKLVEDWREGKKVVPRYEIKEL